MAKLNEEKANLAKEIDKLKSKVYQRQRRIAKNPETSKIGVEVYKNAVKHFSNALGWFTETGSTPSDSNISVRDLRAVKRRYEELDNLNTLTTVGAKDYAKVGTMMFGDGFDELDDEQKGAVYRMLDRIRDSDPGYDADSVMINVQEALDGGQIEFDKEQHILADGSTHETLQIVRMVGKNGRVFSADPKPGEYNIYDIESYTNVPMSETSELHEKRIEYKKRTDSRMNKRRRVK